MIKGVVRRSSDVTRMTANMRKRRNTLTYFDQRHIDHISANEYVPISIQSLWSPYPVTRDEVVTYAAKIQASVPQRIATCVRLFRRMPFVVGCREPMQEVHEHYLKDLRRISEIPPFSLASQWDSVVELVVVTRDLLGNNTEILPLLIDGISDTHGFATGATLYENDPIREEEIKRRVSRFMIEMLQGRMSLRLLLEHLVQLYEQSTDHVHGKHGLVQHNFSPRQLIENIYEEQKPVAEEFFGIDIEPIKIREVNNLSQAHAMANKFPYLVEPIEYSLREVVKNALRAQAKRQLEATQCKYGRPFPDPMLALVVIHDNGFTIRVTDYGEGISPEALEKVWNFNVSISSEDGDELSLEDRTAQLSKGFVGLGSGSDSRSLFGYGCGLPISKIYTEMMGGKVSLKSIEGYCTNVYFDMPYQIRTQNSNRNVSNIDL